jgi:hypothetical protein
MDTTQIAVIMNRLKAAEPIIVPGPKSPASKFNEIVSIIASKISGAELPSAISVKFATVSFHTIISTSSYIVTYVIEFDYLCLRCDDANRLHELVGCN